MDNTLTWLKPDDLEFEPMAVEIELELMEVAV